MKLSRRSVNSRFEFPVPTTKGNDSSGPTGSLKGFNHFRSVDSQLAVYGLGIVAGLLYALCRWGYFCHDDGGVACCAVRVDVGGFRGEEVWKVQK